MKKFIAKIRNKRLKGNVSLLVIFILLASSVIALLSINQIQRLLTYGNMTFNYFRAFYLAKAGTELGLTEVYYREAGFEHSIGTGDAIVSGLALGYTGFNPYFTMNISGNFLHLTDDVRYTCGENNRITLGTGEGIMLSLFTDVTEGFNNILSSQEEKSVIKKMEDNEIRSLNFISSNNGETLTFGFFAYDNDKNMSDIIVKTGSSLNNFLNSYMVQGERRYLTIKNSGDKPVSFCINRNDGGFIPYSDSLITVRGNYGDMEVGLQSVVKKEVPSWSLNVIE